MNREQRRTIATDADVAEARRALRELATAEGLSPVEAEALVTAASELAMNMLHHARGGALTFSAVDEAGRTGVRVTAEDHGPGIADPDRALQDGFSTGSGLGLGLPSARRFVDEFELHSRVGEGTRIRITKWKGR